MIKKIILILIMSFITSSCDFLESGQSPIDSTGKDVITVSKDRTISFNGNKFKLKVTLIDSKKLATVFGVPSRILEKTHIWDDKGIDVRLENGLLVGITIWFDSYNERSPGKFKPEYFVPEFGFNGVVVIEDSNINKETTFEEFTKSKMGKEFKGRTGLFGEYYAPRLMFIEDKPAVSISLATHGGDTKIERIEIY